MPFFFQLYGDHRDLHSFPTRRSSDLYAGFAIELVKGKLAFQKTLIDLRRDSTRSEEHTSELQSRPHLVCRLLLEKKKSLTILTALARTRLCPSSSRHPRPPPTPSSSG